MKRNYTQKTLKVLFALSGNQCAHPECTNTLIEPATENSDALVTAHICHIYAISAEGPRGKSGLTEKELNSPDNLLLLCRNHHAVVDGQHETYPAEMLSGWKQSHESGRQMRLSADLESVRPDIFSHHYFPTALVDQKIEDEVQKLRKSRFFVEFDTVRASLTLGRRIAEGDLSGGTDAVRCRGLAWCSRLLSRSDELGKAEEYLALSTQLGVCPEIDIAQAFVLSQKGEMSAGLKALAQVASPISRSAGLMIVSHHEGAEAAVEWLKEAGFESADLSPEGKYFLLTQQLELGRWDAAREIVDSLADRDLEEAPVLRHMAAIAKLLAAVPVELRDVVLTQVPFEAAGFPLASDESGINARRASHRHFVDAAAAAHELSCPQAAMVDDDYALWLELRDPDQSESGRKRLEQKLRDAKFALRVVHLGLQFGIKLDLASVEKEIEQEIALHGGITRDAALARFALAFTRQSPEEVANYVGEHYEDLAKYLDNKAIRFLQVEMFSKAGLPDRATQCLESLLGNGLTEAEQLRLRRLVAEAEGADPVEARKIQFRQSDSLGDLASLVDELEARRDWEDLCEFAPLLFERTRSLYDAERLATALSNTHRTEQLIVLLRGIPDLLAQSRHLRMLYAWALYHEGALVESRAELGMLRDDGDDPHYRALEVNLGIGLGDWNSLSAFVANEYKHRDKISAYDLLSDAQLAVRLESPHAKDLVFAAVAKGEDDAAVLANAYLLASSAGWEDDLQVSQWLIKAAELSADEGPLQRMSLKDIMERKPEWDRRESETWQLLARGEIPLFLAAQSLHRSLIDLTLFPALANLAEGDPRRRVMIPAYSGKREPLRLGPDNRTAGMDATALLTLSFLDLLDQGLDAFREVWIPHSTLSWLFEEKQRAAFHQPSRIKDSHRLRHLLAMDTLGEFVPSTVPNSDLAAQIGDELAALIAEAERESDDDKVQRIVVRSSPVHRLSSLMEEEADLAAYAPVLSSCGAVVDKLRQRGQLTAEEESRARSYLRLHEKPWPNQPEIADCAVLYLDDLAITYFLHLGILEKFKAAGLRPIASPREVSEANAFISYESISYQVKAAIERIRSALSSRIESGAIKFGRRRLADESTEPLISEHPTIGVIGLASDCDLVFSDDRFLNQHARIDDGTSQAPIASTLDLLDVLADIGAISVDEQLESRTRLRRAGYALVPVKDDELARHLHASEVRDNRVFESAELKAIRENILKVRMSDWLQLPKEASWLDATLKAFIRVLKSLWIEGANLSDVAARSNWLADQVDLRGWAHSLGAENGSNVVRFGRGAHILMLLTPPVNVAEEVKDTYWGWVEDRILTPIHEQFPDLYAWIVEWQRKQIAEMAEVELNEEAAT